MQNAESKRDFVAKSSGDGGCGVGRQGNPIFGPAYGSTHTFKTNGISSWMSITIIFIASLWGFCLLQCTTTAGLRLFSAVDNPPIRLV